jgi:hypothetical protein
MLQMVAVINRNIVFLLGRITTEVQILSEFNLSDMTSRFRAAAMFVTVDT